MHRRSEVLKYSKILNEVSPRLATQVYSTETSAFFADPNQLGNINNRLAFGAGSLATLFTSVSSPLDSCAYPPF